MLIRRIINRHQRQHSSLLKIAVLPGLLGRWTGSGAVDCVTIWTLARVRPSGRRPRGRTGLSLRIKPFGRDRVGAPVSASKGSLGLTILPCYLGESEPAFQRASGAMLEFNIKLGLLTHPDPRHVARVCVFMNFIAAGIAEQTELIEGRLPGATSRRTKLEGRRR